MSRFKRSFLFLILATAALAQNEAQIQSDEVKRVGSHLSCQCGACEENLNCQMSSGQCHFCKPARTKIFNMQQQGISDAGIIAAFVQEYGAKIRRLDPNSYFWIIPYVALGLGAIALWAILRRVRAHHPLKPAVAGGPGIPGPPDDDPTLARYRDAVEKETSRLE